MKDFIPLVVSPYPDELLYSWVARLAKLNELTPETFYRKYFGDCLSKGKYIPLDIRRGYFNFYDALNCDVDKMELYFQLSTTQFELMFYPEKQHLQILNQIVRPENNFNNISHYFIKEPKMCMDCMREDIEQYDECYIHRSHQLSGVCACHKHHSKLYVAKRYFRKSNHKHLYDFNNLVELNEKISEYDIKYSEYANALLQSDKETSANIILPIIFDEVAIEMKDKEFGRKIFSQIMSDVLGDKTKQNRWSRIDVVIPPEETIKILLKYFPDVNKFLNKLPNNRMLIKKHCDKCKNDYYITQYGIDSGWDCAYCDHKLDEQELLKRLITVSGKGEYKVKSSFQSMGQKVHLLHKECGKDFWVQPTNFLFKKTRCDCNQKISKKEAEKRMKKHKHFELIEFSGASLPAIIYHDKCGENFEVTSFRDFLETPKCRHCEITPDMTTELFKQRVVDIVGDEYEVLGEVNRREDRIDIRHNKCGHVTNFKVYEFLEGSRCPHCYCKVRKERIMRMLKEYADDRYTIVGHDKYRFIIYDNEENREIKLRGKHIVQEMLRPTPSTILPTHKEKLEKSPNTWETWYKLCIEFKQEFGHLAISHDQYYNGMLLGDWCSMQRILYNKGELPEDKIQLLKEIDFVFDMVFYYWNKRFEEYKDYVQETGNYFPPIDCIHNGNKVGAWFLGQRKERKRGKLNPIYEKILLEYNPEFFKERNAWDTRYARMKQ